MFLSAARKAKQSDKKLAQNEIKQLRENLLRRHQDIIAKAIQGNPKSPGTVTSKTTPDVQKMHDTLLDMSWANASGETVLSYGDFSLASIDGLCSDDFVDELKAAIETQDARIQAIQEAIETYQVQAKLRYVSHDKPNAVVSMQMVYSWQEKLVVQEGIHQELVAFLLTTKQTGMETVDDIEDKRERMQMILDSEFSGPRGKVIPKDDDVVLREIENLNLGDSEHASTKRFVWVSKISLYLEDSFDKKL